MTQASSGVTDEDVSMEIFLISGESVIVQAQSFSRSDEVLEVYTQYSRGLAPDISLSLSLFLSTQRAVVGLGVAPSLTYYFSLFLEEKTQDSSWTSESHQTPPSISPSPSLPPSSVPPSAGSRGSLCLSQDSQQPWLLQNHTQNEVSVGVAGGRVFIVVQVSGIQRW